MLESNFQRKRLIEEIENTYPGAIVLKTDPSYIRSFPDLLILEGDRWASLETKRSSTASHQPNQPYYVKLLNQMSYASFVHPNNIEEVMRGLQQTFR